jgi:hypothetical protein
VRGLGCIILCLFQVILLLLLLLLAVVDYHWWCIRGCSCWRVLGAYACATSDDTLCHPHIISACMVSRVASCIHQIQPYACDVAVLLRCLAVFCRPFDPNQATSASGGWCWVGLPRSLLINGKQIMTLLTTAVLRA